ncbi:alpha/beta fold hydrolase [Streptomyces sp. ISL-12]|uniref:alpha/beta fold hydrolase n=1 Tax=Streptomyces sp. ISL-12 TaxID=2819177 RepID=UPI001BE53D45|nr:alpha/beta hydrolase [Streptomyces sp. ISL-12]MBT2412346.1 alpha/beta fold hydrolase [Streptomyces sp. ISL-12]
MLRTIKATAMAALCCAVAGTGLVACEETPTVDGKAIEESVDAAVDDALDDADAVIGATFTGTKKIKAEGRSVNLSCAGAPADGRPVIVLLAGAGDGLDKMADLRKTLGERDRVCSYDRLGEGASDQPAATQRQADSGKVLTAVLNHVAGDGPVVLAGHSLGGLIAARYAPDHQDRVKGLVLMDATIPALDAGLAKAVPDSATGPAAELRDQTLAANQGQNPERFVIEDAKVRSAGDIPVAVIQHETQFAEVPEYGPALEGMWSAGQQQWLALSSRSKLTTAAGSGHYIYTDRPDLAVEAVRDVATQAAADQR